MVFTSQALVFDEDLKDPLWMGYFFLDPREDMHAVCIAPEYASFGSSR